MWESEEAGADRSGGSSSFAGAYPRDHHLDAMILRQLQHAADVAVLERRLRADLDEVDGEPHSLSLHARDLQRVGRELGVFWVEDHERNHVEALALVSPEERQVAVLAARPAHSSTLRRCLHLSTHRIRLRANSSLSEALVPGRHVSTEGHQ